MIEIYLNPANDMIYSSIQETDYATTKENIDNARELTNELKVKGVDTTIVECQILIATKEKQYLEKAQKKLKEKYEKNKNHVPTNVCMGLCLFILKKSSDAKNYLKPVVTSDY